MKFNEIKELIELINESDLSYLEVKTEESYIKMDKSISRDLATASVEKKVVETVVNEEKPVETIAPQNACNLETAVDNDDDFEYIKSPMVGTFYKAVSPEEDPFVTVGQNVAKGQVLCIVEAMKLMNEITAEFDCEIVSVVAENGNMVEFGAPMFKVRRK